MAEVLATDGCPIVAAYLTRRRRGFGRFYLVPCPYCEYVHLHGDREGRRITHCGGAAPAREYQLKHAGPVPKWVRRLRDTGKRVVAFSEPGP